MGLVAFFFLTITLSVTLVENADVVEGITCRSYAAANASGVVASCKRLWLRAKMIPNFDESRECKYCRRLFKQHSTDYKYLAFALSKSQHYPNIDSESLKYLAADLESDILCALLDRCGSSSFALPTLKFSVKSTCNDCKKIMDDIRVLLQDNETKAGIADFLKREFCYALPLQVVDICKHTIDTFINVYIDWAAGKLNSEVVCSNFGLCPNTGLGVKVMPVSYLKNPKPEAYSWIKKPAPVGFEFFHSRLSLTDDGADDSASCTKCTDVFSRIRDETKDPAFYRELKNLVKSKFCEPFSFAKALCETLISKEVDGMIQDASNTSITDLCYILKQCTQNVSPAAKALKASLSRNLTPSARIGSPSFPIICPMCEMLLKRVIDLTVNNRSVAAIEWALERACQLLPASTTRAECKRFIEQYSDFIIRGFLSPAAPELICSSIGACGESATIPAVTGKPVAEPNLKDSCAICEIVFTDLYSKLRENDTVEHIESLFEGLCSYVPMGYSDLCRVWVEQKTATLINRFMQNFPPRKMCEGLSICYYDASSLPREKSGCQICKTIVDFIYAKLESNASVDEITKVMETVCSYLPTDSLVENCKMCVRAYASELIKLLEEQIPSAEVCQKLGLCELDAPPKLPWVESAEACRFCRSLLSQRLTFGGFALNCSIYDSPLAKSRCNTVKALNVPDRLAFTNLESVCKENKLCDNPSESSRNLNAPYKKNVGDDPCLWGPSVTCRDANIAARCEATTYCQQHVWRANEPQSESERIPQMSLIDCSLPLPELCVSPSVHHCGPTVREQCRLRGESVSVVNDLRHDLCKDRSPNLCSDARMVEICAISDYCEAMGMSPALSNGETLEVSTDPRCRLGPSFACQTHDNAVLCGQVTLCSTRFWPRMPLS